MTLILGGGDVSYTVQEVRDLRDAVAIWVNDNYQSLDPRLVEAVVQTHMVAGHKAADING